MNKSYDLFSELVRVKDLMEPFGPEISTSMSLEEANDVIQEDCMEHAYDPLSRIYLVRQGNLVVGLLFLEEFKQTLDESIEPINVNIIIHEESRLINVIPAFTKNDTPYLIVLGMTGFSGFLFFSDLIHSLPFKICMFALTQDIESAALRLILEKSKESWACLPEGRKKLARDVFLKWHGKEAEENFADQLLHCTLFIDKATILKKMQLLNDISNSLLEETFIKADRLRNYCAHTKEQDDIPATIADRFELVKYINNILTIINSINTIFYSKGF